MMIKKHFLRISPCAVLLFLITLPGCAPRPSTSIIVGEALGTVYSVKVVAEQGATGAEIEGDIADRVRNALSEIDAKMSSYREDSELSRFNQLRDTTPFSVSRETAYVFALAQQVSEESNGAFDITVAPLVNAWGFGPDGRFEQILDAEAVAALQKYVDYRLIEVDRKANTIRKTHPEVQCDLRGIAKGYAVDHIAQALDDGGYIRYMIEVGGEVRTRGESDANRPWRIAIEQPLPHERAIQTVLPLNGWSLATSGDYRNFFKDDDGQRYSHTIDPRTGKPVRHKLAAVSVIHQECAMADAYATAFMVLGPADGLALADELGLKALFQLHTDGPAFTQKKTKALMDMLDE